MQQRRQQTQTWQQDYETILNDMSPAEIEQFQGDPETVLEQYGVSIGSLTENLLSDEQAIDPVAARLGDSDPNVSFKTRWWGVQVILNEAATQLAVQGSNGLSTLSKAIAGGTAGIPGFGSLVAAMASVFALAFQLQAAAIQFVDDGSGVHFNWTWAQLGFLTVPVIGPVAIASMLTPVSNSEDARRRK